MSFTVPDIGNIDELLNQLCMASWNYKQDHNDLERIAALKAARKLVQALDDPDDGSLMMAFSVPLGAPLILWNI